jgi:hypothetical protein
MLHWFGTSWDGDQIQKDIAGVLNEPSVVGGQYFSLSVGLGTYSLLLWENQHVMDVIEGLRHEQILGTL